MKPCKRCYKSKPIESFSVLTAAKDGLQSWCKDCAKEYNLDYGRKYRLTEHGQEVRKNSDMGYAKTPDGKQAQRIATKKFRLKHPDRYNCHKKVGTAIRNGTLVVEPCDNCFDTHDIEAHHEDYSKPLEIIWLCKICHKNLNRRF